jgi:hypothetical protein
MNYGGRLKTKVYDKRDAVTFLIVNFHFISSSIQASPVYEVYVTDAKLESRRDSNTDLVSVL